MRWLSKMLLRLLVLALIVFSGWAYFAELPPPTERVVIDLEPPADTGAADVGE